MKTILAACLLLLFAGAACGQSRLPLKNLHEIENAPHPADANLTKTQIAAIRIALHRALHMEPFETLDEPFEETFRQLRVERVSLGATEGLVVQGMSLEVCGATGNCLFMVFDGNAKLLYRSFGIQSFSAFSIRSHRLSDLLLYTHNSAMDGYAMHLRFDGNGYRILACYLVTYEDLTTMQSFDPPHEDRISCKTRKPL